ncbi:MAG: hypothetical protein WCS77_09060 [Elusimicrobiaceae bacterium]|jgi:flavodoxin
MEQAEILITYYSRTGHARQIAMALAARLDADCSEITDLKNRRGLLNWFLAGRDAIKQRLTEIGPVDKNAKNYRLVIVGTPIWGGNITPAARTYLASQKDSLPNVAFFTVCAGCNPENAFREMETVSGKTAARTISFFDNELKNPVIYAQKLENFAKGIEKSQ